MCVLPLVAISLNPRNRTFGSRKAPLLPRHGLALIDSLLRRRGRILRNRQAKTDGGCPLRGGAIGRDGEALVVKGGDNLAVPLRLLRMLYLVVVLVGATAFVQCLFFAVSTTFRKPGDDRAPILHWRCPNASPESSLRLRPQIADNPVSSPVLAAHTLFFMPHKGHERTLHQFRPMSALSPIADIVRRVGAQSLLRKFVVNFRRYAWSTTGVAR
jgi:hypothetical protein